MDRVLNLNIADDEIFENFAFFQNFLFDSSVSLFYQDKKKMH